MVEEMDSNTAIIFIDENEFKDISAEAVSGNKTWKRIAFLGLFRSSDILEIRSDFRVFVLNTVIVMCCICCNQCDYLSQLWISCMLAIFFILSHVDWDKVSLWTRAWFCILPPLAITDLAPHESSDCFVNATFVIRQDHGFGCPPETHQLPGCLCD